MTQCDWAAPIVAVPKKDGRFHICGNYKVTVNGALDVDQYPLPNPRELFATLTGGKTFTKLDLSQANQQLLLDQESTKYVTVTTHKGSYRCNKLPFSVASAPAIFQKTIDTILQGIPPVMLYWWHPGDQSWWWRPFAEPGWSSQVSSTSWYRNEKEQMSLHGDFSSVPGALNRFWRTPCYCRQGGGNSERPNS